MTDVETIAEIFGEPMSKRETTNTQSTTLLPTRRERRPGKISVRILDAGDPRPVGIESTSVTIGRSHLADIQVAHASVSKLHCRLTISSDGIELLDLESKNGTWIGPRRVFHVGVSVGDVIVVGQCRIEILAGDTIEVDATEVPRCGEMFGASLVMRELFARLDRLGGVDVPVVFLGEIGVGKEVAARTLHELSPRSAGPFAVLDAAVLPRSGLDEVVLDGSAGEVPTLLDRARGGTLFIDNIDEFPLPSQSVLLRLIQHAPTQALDVRVMASSRRDLRQVVVDGRLREDLYYQIAPTVVEIPPLRKRRDDIAPLALELLAQANAAYERRLTLADDTLAMLQSRDWPGNVRELRGTIVRAVIETPGDEITPADIVLGTPRSLPVDVLLSASYADAHKALDQHFLPLVIDNAGYNISRIAERLGISRPTVRALLRDHGLYPFDRPDRTE